MRGRLLGPVRYADGLALQARLVADRRAGRIADSLLLLEHPPVITRGRGARDDHVLLSVEQLSARGIEVHDAGRGGDVTYHGPGQLVGYPILALEDDERDAHRYLRNVEEALLRAVGDLGIEATRAPGLTGIWVGTDKLAAIGVRLSTGWITSHGFALNVAADLSGFETIVPCGIAGRGVTSVARLLGREPDPGAVAERCATRFAEVFGRRLAWDRDGAVS